MELGIRNSVDRLGFSSRCTTAGAVEKDFHQKDKIETSSSEFPTERKKIKTLRNFHNEEKIKNSLSNFHQKEKKQNFFLRDFHQKEKIENLLCMIFIRKRKSRDFHQKEKSKFCPCGLHFFEPEQNQNYVQMSGDFLWREKIEAFFGDRVFMLGRQNRSSARTEDEDFCHRIIHCMLDLHAERL